MTQSKGTAKDREILKADKPGVRTWRRNAVVVLGLLAMMFPAWGAGEHKIDQLVIDVTNVWCNKLGRAVTDALLRLATWRGGLTSQRRCLTMASWRCFWRWRRSRSGGG